MSRISSQIIFGDLTGGINNVDNKEIINSSTKKTQTPDMLNVEYFKLGGIKSMKGNTVVGDIQEDKVIGGWEYTKGNKRYMIIGLANGKVKIYNEATSTFDTIFTFAHSSNRMSFCNMNNGVVVTNGVDDLVFYEKDRREILSGNISTTANSPDVVGTNTKFTLELKPGDTITFSVVSQDTTTWYTYYVDSIIDNTHLTLRTDADVTISDGVYYLAEVSECNATLVNEEDENVNVPIRGLAIQYYNGRLWVGTDNGLFYSQVGQYNKWDIKYDAGVLYSIYNDTSEIKALGLFSEFMVIHKKFSSYILTCTDDASTIQVKPFSNITCESQQSWIVSNTKYYIYSREFMDIYPLVQHTVFSDKFLGEPITQKVRNIFLNLISENSGNIFCVSRPKARQMIFYLPLANQLGSSYGLIYDFQTKSWLLRNVPQDVTIAFNYNSNIYLGTSDGMVLKEFNGNSFKVLNEDNEIVDTAIISYYKSPWFDWANAYMQSFAEFMIEIDNSSENNFYIRTEKDGQSRTEDRIIDSSKLNGDALIFDGYSPEVTNYYIFYSTIDDEPIERYRIPKLKATEITDTSYTIDSNLFIKLYQEGYNLIIKTYNPITKVESNFQTITDYYLPSNIDYLGQDLPDNITVWDNDIWVKGTFENIRMLLPNNVFEDFQIEIGTNELGQAFSIYQYGFRRIETEEAPW